MSQIVIYGDTLCTERTTLNCSMQPFSQRIELINEERLHTAIQCTSLVFTALKLYFLTDRQLGGEERLAHGQEGDQGRLLQI